MSEAASDPDLKKQYELVLQEYRFQVLLNWDRAKHYLVFNTAIFGAAAALYKSATSWASEAAVAALLVVAALNSYAGQLAVALGQHTTGTSATRRPGWSTPSASKNTRSSPRPAWNALMA